MNRSGMKSRITAVTFFLLPVSALKCYWRHGRWNADGWRGMSLADFIETTIRRAGAELIVLDEQDVPTDHPLR
jgi:hypothetical protein